MDKRDVIRNLIPPGLRRFLKYNIGTTALHARIASLEERMETDVLALHTRIDQLEEYLCKPTQGSFDLRFANGFFEGIQYHDGKLNISGWMILPERAFDSAALYIGQSKVAECRTVWGEAVYPFISHSRHARFHFSVSQAADTLNEAIDICVVGISGGRELAKMETWFRREPCSRFPVPPPHLMLRETGASSPSFHLTSGLQCFKEFWTAACRHMDPRAIKNMLDWGCGCGRITRFFLELSEIPKINGCDIDAEAIAWCQENLKPGAFSATPLYPPTPYSDQAFDLVTAFSVLTHLSKENQSGWLEEMQRILTPGGLFLATVHGEFAATFRIPGMKARIIFENGIYDELDGGTLDGVAPEGYYRGVFQKREYTMKEYSRYFEVLEYIEGGALNFQDLVVMRKKK